MLNEIKRFFKEEEGAAGIEYTLLLLVIVISLTIFYGPISAAANTIWGAINTAFTGAATNAGS